MLFQVFVTFGIAGGVWNLILPVMIIFFFIFRVKQCASFIVCVFIKHNCSLHCFKLQLSK